MQQNCSVNINESENATKLPQSRNSILLEQLMEQAFQQNSAVTKQNVLEGRNSLHFSQLTQ